MNKTLTEHISAADATYRDILNNRKLIPRNKLQAYMTSLEVQMREIQAVSYRIYQMYQASSRLVDFEPGETFPDDHEWARAINPLIDNIPAVCVDTLNDVPNTPLTWVRNIRQFAFQVEGVYFRGNVGSICFKRARKHSIDKCPRGNNCINLLHPDTICDKWHDPLDIAELPNHMAIMDKMGDRLIRNFINTSWLYTGNPKSLFTRTCCSKDDDIQVSEIFSSQVMHDCLIHILSNI